MEGAIDNGGNATICAGKWKRLGRLIVEGKQFKNVGASSARMNEVFEAEGAATPKFPALLGLCPQFKTIIVHAVVVRVGFQVAKFDKQMVEWNEEDAVKVGRSMSTFVRTTTSPSIGSRSVAISLCTARSPLC